MNNPQRLGVRRFSPEAHDLSRAGAEPRLRQIRWTNRNCLRWAAFADQLAQSARSLSDSVSGPSCSNLSNQRTAARAELSSLFPCFRPYIFCRLKSPTTLPGILSRSKRRQPLFQRRAAPPPTGRGPPRMSLGNERHAHLKVTPVQKY